MDKNLFEEKIQKTIIESSNASSYLAQNGRYFIAFLGTAVASAALILLKFGRKLNYVN